MKFLAIVVLTASLGTMGCSNSEQASAGDEGATDLAQAQTQSTQAQKSPAATASNTEATKSPGNLAPDWQLFDITGSQRYSDEFAGKIRIVDFWATWCGPCKMEIPHFVELQNEYKDDLVIIGMALDQVTRVAPFSKRFNINYVNLIANQQVARDFRVGRSIPVTYVIDQDGSIYKRYVGYRPKEVFESDIKTLLARVEG